MPRLDQLSEIHRKSALFFPCLEHDDSPWTPWERELSESRVSLVSTAGLHLRGDRLFQGGDPSYRVIPSDASTGDIILSHVSIGFDHTGIYRDLLAQLTWLLPNLACCIGYCLLVRRGTAGTQYANR